MYGSENSGPTPGPTPVSPIDDRLHPYYLHHSDNPGCVLVSQLLTGENYPSWSQAMLIALSVKNKVGFVNGDLQKPNSSEANMYNSWMRNNNLVISWILNSVSKEISASIMFAESAHEIWNDLKDRFCQSNGPRIFQIRREITHLNQNQDSISVYFTKLKSLWEELSNFRPHCSCGKCECNGVKEIEKFFQTEHVMNFLMGLNESFSSTRGQILLMDPLPAINRVFSLVAQEEKQKSVSNENSNSMAFLAKSNVRKFPAANSNFNAQRRDRPFCTHCKYQGHTIEKCYKLHGYPPGYKSKAKINHSAAAVNTSDINENQNGTLNDVFQSFTPVQCQHLMSALSNHMISVNPNEETATGKHFSLSVHNGDHSHVWIIDSGATQHICHDIDMFFNKRKVNNHTVTLPNKMVLPVHIVGDVKIDHLFTLQGVLYVPKFDLNLISVGSLTKAQKLMIQFTCDHAFI